MSFRMEGLEELREQLTRKMIEVSKQVDDASKKISQKIITDAHSRAVGTLKRSLKFNRASKGNRAKGFIVARITIRKGYQHAIPVELGHRLVFFGMETNKQVEPKPFIRPAIDANTQMSKNELIDAINRGLERR